jgi:hypothetical protein
MTNESNEPVQTTITKQDVEGVAEKLEQFAESLPEQERNVLGWILTRAQSAEEADVTGHSFGLVQPQLLGGFSSPISSQLARSAGLGAASGTTTVSWGYKFGRELGGFQQQVLPG